MDRNHTVQIIVVKMYTSLSARRAWIEILICFGSLAGPSVALRKESVDRNNDTTQKKNQPGKSLSARRAWIEIQKLLKKY